MTKNRTTETTVHERKINDGGAAAKALRGTMRRMLDAGATRTVHGNNVIYTLSHSDRVEALIYDYEAARIWTEDDETPGQWTTTITHLPDPGRPS